MNIRFGNKANLIELAEDLRQVSARKEQPAPYDWEKMRQLLEDNAQYLETYIIPRTPDEEPGYKSQPPRIASFEAKPATDLEMHPDESSASTPFLASAEAANGEHRL